jgi:ABC-type glycerol-3-phosphate transport system substrate-binding protein
MTHKWIGLLTALLAAAIALAPARAQDVTPEAAPPLTTLRLWFPDNLAPPDDPAVTALLASVVQDFEAANPDVQVDLRIKRAGDAATPGSVVHSLRSARAVAPGALPHLTLLRQSELSAAARDGLVAAVPEDSAASAADLFVPAAAALGRLDGVRFGVPFLLEVEHLAAAPDVEPPARLAFSDVLAADWRFVFPAGQASPASDLLIAQIAEAGGLTEDGMLAPDRDTLAAIYQFYADALNAGLIPAEASGYDAPADYVDLLTGGEAPAGLISSSDFLRLRADGGPLSALPLPTLNGSPASVLNGWLWVMPAGSPDEQAVALRFIRWMNDPARQADLARAAAAIPAQTAAFDAWAIGDYGAMIDSILAGALPLSDWAARQPDLGRALQAGLLDVWAGTATPDQAAAALEE